MSLTLFGTRIDFPILIAPTAMHKMAHPDGEIATAKAAKEMGTIYTLSSLSTTSVEDVAKASNAPKWFQLYVLKERKVTEKLVRKVEAHGFTALCLTVDTPFLGRRENDIRNDFHLPSGLNLKILEVDGAALPTGLNNYVAQQLDSSLDWNDLAWLRSITKLPVIVKGIHSPEDAILAINHGASGIIVSNHGARQLDTVPATIEMLPHIVKVVAGRIPVLLDGGIRRGTDVIKALALGAQAVFIGRPVLWGLAVSGEDGVKDVLRLLKEEFRIAMALCGCPTLSTIKRVLIFDVNKLSKL